MTGLNQIHQSRYKNGIYILEDADNELDSLNSDIVFFIERHLYNTVLHKQNQIHDIKIDEQNFYLF